MSGITLLPRPAWLGNVKNDIAQQQSPYWTKYRCSYSCRGHIFPFNRAHEIHISESSLDLVQWILVREQELHAHEALVNLPKKVEKKYTPKPKPEQKTGGSSGKGFGTRH